LPADSERSGLVRNSRSTGEPVRPGVECRELPDWRHPRTRSSAGCGQGTGSFSDGRRCAEAARPTRRITQLDPKFGTPIEQATTSSFEALKAFSLGQEIRHNKSEVEAIPFFQRAVALDSNFAMAYASLDTSFINTGNEELGIANIRKAYELPDRASEREKFRIATYYFAVVTGDQEKVKETCQQWVLAYPRDWLAHGLLGDVLASLGDPKSGEEEYAEALRINPDATILYSNLFPIYVALGRLDDAEAAIRNGEKRGNYIGFHFDRYILAFLRNDVAGMQQQVAWSASKPEGERVLLGLEAKAAAYSGRLANARCYSPKQAGYFLSSVSQSSNTETLLGSIDVKAMPIPANSREYATLP